MDWRLMVLTEANCEQAVVDERHRANIQKAEDEAGG
jgi:hypothetical protein